VKCCICYANIYLQSALSGRNTISASFITAIIKTRVDTLYCKIN